MIDPLLQTPTATTATLSSTQNPLPPEHQTTRSAQPITTTTQKHWLNPDIFKHMLNFCDFREWFDMRLVSRKCQQSTDEHINHQPKPCIIDFTANLKRLLKKPSLDVPLSLAAKASDKLLNISLTPLENLLKAFDKLTLKHSLTYANDSTQLPQNLTVNTIKQLCQVIASVSNSDHKQFTLDLTSDHLTSVYLKELSANKAIKHLRLQDPHITSADLAEIAKKFPNLEQLDVIGANNITLEQLGDLPKLKVLNLSYSRIRNEDLTFIAQHCPHLETLDLSNTKITSLEHLGDLLELKTLLLPNCHLHNKDLAYIAPHCPHLETLRLSNNPITSLEYLGDLLELKTLYLDNDLMGNCHIRNEDLAYIAKHCPHLETLYLSNNPITSLEHLKDLLKLRALYLDRTNIQNEDLVYIAQHCPHLEVLDLNNTKITSLEYLGDLQELRELNLEHTPINNQTLADITPERVPKLAALDLKYTPISSLEYLPNLLFLKCLNLIGTKIPKNNLAALKSRLPHTKIEYEFHDFLNIDDLDDFEAFSAIENYED